MSQEDKPRVTKADVAGVTDDSVKVYWNGEKLSIRNFADYVKLFDVAFIRSFEYRELYRIWI